MFTKLKAFYTYNGALHGFASFTIAFRIALMKPE